MTHGKNIFKHLVGARTIGIGYLRAQTDKNSQIWV
jgi:hypothetical protein